MCSSDLIYLALTLDAVGLRCDLDGNEEWIFVTARDSTIEIRNRGPKSLFSRGSPSGMAAVSTSASAESESSLLLLTHAAMIVHRLQGLSSTRAINCASQPTKPKDRSRPIR